MTIPPAILLRRRRAHRVAALAPSAQGWRLVVVDRGTPPTLVESRTLAEADLASLGDVLRTLKVALIVRVVPAGECIARLSDAPGCQESELPAALAVIAASELPEDLPEHRKAVGVLGLVSGPCTVAFGWGGEPAAIATDADQVFVPEPAAAMVLAGKAPLAYAADPKTGSAFAFASGPGGSHLRCTRLDVREGRFAEGLRRAVQSIASAAGVELPATDPVASASTGLSTSLSSAAMHEHAARVCKGVRSDNAWLGQYGVAVGAAVLALSHDPATESFAGLRAKAGDGPRSRLARAAIWLSIPRNAVAVIAIGLAATLLVPLASAYARLKIVESKSNAMGDAEKRRRDLSRDAALYRQLSKTRWPITKLLSDLSRASPKGVIIDQLTLEQEGSGGVTIRGKAENADVLTTLQANLDNTGILASVAVADIKNSASSVEFTIVAKVRDPLIASSIKEDYATKTLQARMYPDGAGTEEVEAPAGHSPDDAHATDAPEGESAPASDPSTGNGRALRGENAKPTDSTKSSKDEIPAPITDAEIAALDKSKATLEWAKRRAMSQKSSTDPTTKARLEEEVKKLEVRRQELSK